MLDRDVVLEIRKRYDLGYPRQEIAKGYGVSVTTVSLIGKRRVHKRVRDGSVKPYPNSPKNMSPTRDDGKIQRIEARLRRNRPR